MRTDPEPMTAVLTELASPHTSGHPARRPLPFPGPEPLGRPVAHVPADPDDDVLGLPAVLRTRRSTLRYAATPVRTAPVLDLVRAALVEDRRTWDLDTQAGPLEAFVFALRSSDLPAGVHRVTVDGTTMIAPISAVGPLEDLGIQREFSTAAGIVATYARLDQAEGWAGAHGYRISATRAAMATYDVHLRCVARGLVGTMFGGFIPSAVRDVVQGDGVTRHPLIAATYALPVADALPAR